MSKPSHKIGTKHGHNQDLSIYDFGTNNSLMLINDNDNAEPEPAKKASGSDIQNTGKKGAASGSRTVKNGETKWQGDGCTQQQVTGTIYHHALRLIGSPVEQCDHKVSDNC